ncbi:LytR/AlgR family response regulator transcription factor [Cecembia rubra]|uniref:LytR/AlgR family response regulator transcription factor n=1 Tax=Cecembia rubra TaxID=1485585 RepID=UPI0027151F94|nr:LytTR family DNA-binding domain-containing protein [Cecembia rubra]
MEKINSKDKEYRYHPDILVFLFAIPIINAINFHLTYANISFNSFFINRFLIDLVQGYLAWWIVRWLILTLDKKIPYSADPIKRISIQLLLTTFAGLFFIASTTEILSILIKGEFAPIDFYTKDLLIIAVWFLVINGYYIGMYFFHEWQASIQNSDQFNPKGTGLNVKTGNKNLLVKFPEIFYIKVDGDYVQLTDFSNNKYYLDSSLDKIEKMLPELDFFRINRQILVHRQLVKGFKRIENGKLEVQLEGEFSSLPDLTISRTKAPAFRTWFMPKS